MASARLASLPCASARSAADCTAAGSSVAKSGHQQRQRLEPANFGQHVEHGQPCFLLHVASKCPRDEVIVDAGAAEPSRQPGQRRIVAIGLPVGCHQARERGGQHRSRLARPRKPSSSAAASDFRSAATVQQAKSARYAAGPSRRVRPRSAAQTRQQHVIAQSAICQASGIVHRPALPREPAWLRAPTPTKATVARTDRLNPHHAWPVPRRSADCRAAANAWPCRRVGDARSRSCRLAAMCGQPPRHRRRNLGTRHPASRTVHPRTSAF